MDTTRFDTTRLQFMDTTRLHTTGLQFMDTTRFLITFLSWQDGGCSKGKLTVCMCDEVMRQCVLPQIQSLPKAAFTRPRFSSEATIRGAHNSLRR